MIQRNTDASDGKRKTLKTPPTASLTLFLIQAKTLFFFDPAHSKATWSTVMSEKSDSTTIFPE